MHTHNNISSLRRGHLRRVPGGVLRVGAELLRGPVRPEVDRPDGRVVVYAGWLRGATDGPDRLGRRERLLDRGQYCQLFTGRPDGRLCALAPPVLGGAVPSAAAAGGVGGVLTLGLG